MMRIALEEKTISGCTCLSTLVDVNDVAFPSASVPFPAVLSCQFGSGFLRALICRDGLGRSWESLMGMISRGKKDNLQITYTATNVVDGSKQKAIHTEKYQIWLLDM